MKKQGRSYPLISRSGSLTNTSGFSQFLLYHKQSTLPTCIFAGLACNRCTRASKRDYQAQHSTAQLPFSSCSLMSSPNICSTTANENFSLQATRTSPRALFHRDVLNTSFSSLISPRFPFTASGRTRITSTEQQSRQGLGSAHGVCLGVEMFCI
jgi:hypothetical protein